MVYKLKPKLPLSDLAEWRNGSASDSSMWNATLPQWSLQKVIRSNRVSVILFYFYDFTFSSTSTTAHLYSVEFQSFSVNEAHTRSGSVSMVIVVAERAWQEESTT